MVLYIYIYDMYVFTRIYVLYNEPSPSPASPYTVYLIMDN